MKTIGCYIAGALATAMLLVGCGSAKYASSSDDLYNPDSRLAIAKREAARAELEKAEAEARRAKYEALLAQQQADKAESDYRNGKSILSDDDDFSSSSVYARKLYAFDSPTYILPAAYYDYRYSYYDPFYNVVVVEPRYVSSLYGLWGPSYYYAWNRPWYGTSWSWGWGGAYWNWTMSWNWGWGWDPYWGWGGHYPPHHHYPGYHPPHHDGGPAYSHRPNYRTFGNGYRNPATNNIAQGSDTRNPAGSGYRPSNTSKSDYYNNRGGNSGSSNSRPSSNNKNNSYNSSRGSGTVSSGNRTSTNSSTTYRRGSGSTSSSSSSSGNGGSYTNPSRGSSFGSGGSSHSGGSFGGGTSSGGGSGRTQGGR